MAEKKLQVDSPISIVDKGTPSTSNLPKGSIAIEKDKNNNLKIYGNVGNEVVDIERVDALDNGDASASFVAGRNLKVNGWEFYWKDVWEESEPSAIKHIESAGVNAAINEIKGTGADVSAFTFPTTKDEFIAYLKTITFDFSNQPNQVSGYGSVTYGIMNKNAGTTTIVEGMYNDISNKMHRSHIEGQHMSIPDVEYALSCHVEGQDCDIVGYALFCHLEGYNSAVVHSMGKNVGFFDEAVGCHVEGGGGVVGGAYSHVEGDGCAALNYGAHCEGKGYYKNSVTDWKKRTAKDNDYLKDLWKKILFGKTDTSGYTYKFSAAIGNASHVEGIGNIAPKASVTLEGLDTGATASFVNGANHAEGAGNFAGAAASHAEGIRNEIGHNAYASHAEGIKNTTQNRAEHASGQYNKSSKATDTFGDAGNTLFSVGCGTSDADRKNAFEVMQDGTCKYLDVATGEQIDVGVAKELSKPFDLTIGSTTKKVDGKSAVAFTAEEINASGQNYELILSDLTTIDTTNSILPTTKAEWTELRNDSDLPIILKLPIGTYKCVGVTETSGVYHFEFILNNQDAQSEFGVYKFIVDTTSDPNAQPIFQTVEYIDRMPKQQTATSTVNAFNGSLIQGLVTTSTEADIRKAFINTKNHATEFPMPGSVIAKLDGSNRGIVVSLSEPDATTLGRSIVVYYGDGTYTIVVKNDFTKVLVPWRKDSSLRDLYVSAGAKYNEATGFYELNGLTDITEEEMRKIYLLYITNSSKAEHIVSWLSYPNDFRTNIAPRVYYVSNIQNSIGRNNALEVLVLSVSALYIQNLVATAHGSFPKLRRVIGYWVYANNDPSKYNFSYGQPFSNCPLLEEIRMKSINKSHTFAVSPNLSKESVLYMITNANPPSGAAVGSIAITLHPTAYARLKDDADIVAALEAKNGVITLVSA